MIILWLVSYLYSLDDHDNNIDNLFSICQAIDAVQYYILA